MGRLFSWEIAPWEVMNGWSGGGGSNIKREDLTTLKKLSNLGLTIVLELQPTFASMHTAALSERLARKP